jgi:hypothetical protein
MTSTLVAVGLAAWMAFVAAGFVWFVWGMVQTGVTWFVARRARAVSPETETKREMPT